VLFKLKIKNLTNVYKKYLDNLTEAPLYDEQGETRRHRDFSALSQGFVLMCD